MAQGGSHSDRPVSDETPSAKIWSVYVAEAEKYDRALVQSWKDDMQGLLIFAGLFSASLTAFIVESYKTLSADQGEIMIGLLTQISQQAAGTNVSSHETGTAPALTPSNASLACNTLWFLSLGLSLACALFATLVDQWARNFSQKVDMRPSPIVRARIFSYLYYGLRRFRMHTVVELIPLLLHLSLFLFFAGLVAFLHPINILVTVLAAAILALMSAAYGVLTILPILFSDCPYRTPLAPVVWHITHNTINNLWRLLPSAHPPASPTLDSVHGQTMVEVMTMDAQRDSSQLHDRDTRALIWTVRSSTDDAQLEPFVAGIPDILHNSKARLHLYDKRVIALATHRESRILQRLGQLLQSSASDLLPHDVALRRRIVCLRALWSLLHISGDFADRHGRLKHDLEVFDRSTVELVHSKFESDARTIAPLVVSVRMLFRWSAFCAISNEISRFQDAVNRKGTSRDHLLPSLLPPLQIILQLIRGLEIPSTAEEYENLFAHCTSHQDHSVPVEQWAQDVLQQLCGDQQAIYCHLMLGFFQRAINLEELPYQFDMTFETVRLHNGLQLPQSSAAEMEKMFMEMATPPRASWSKWDTLIRALLFMWHPTELSKAGKRSLVAYLNNRTEYDLSTVLQLSEGWLFCHEISVLLLDENTDAEDSCPPEEIFTAIWRLGKILPEIGIIYPKINARCLGQYKTTIDTILAQETQSPTSVSAMAIIREALINTIEQDIGGYDLEHLTLICQAGILPDISAFSVPNTSCPPPLDLATMSQFREAVFLKCREAHLVNLTQFLDSCTSSVVFPYLVIETLSNLAAHEITRPVHPVHQRSFVSALLKLANIFVEPGSKRHESAIAFISQMLFRDLSFLDDSISRSNMLETVHIWAKVEGISATPWLSAGLRKLTLELENAPIQDDK